MLIVSDTTPIISLLKAKRLDLLKEMFHTVVIPPAVYDELVSDPKHAGEASLVKNSDLLVIGHVRDTQSVRMLRRTERLDAGESEAIILSKERMADLLLMDERRGRQVAKRLGLNITGTVGILLRAFDEGRLSGHDVMDCLERMRRCNIRMSRDLIESVERHIFS